MKNFHCVDHPLLKRDLTLLRNKKTSSRDFRIVLHRASMILALEATADLRVVRKPVTTPLARTQGAALADDIVIVPVLRAGLALVEAFLELLPDARVGHVGMYRDEITLRPVDYYFRFPRSLPHSVVFLVDPMLATGGSGSAAITFLKERGARRLRFVTLLAAPEGVRKVTRDHPDVPIISGSLDRKLNEKGYILPGLGDAGDRYFGTL